MYRLELEAEQARSDLTYKMDMYEKKKEVLRSILGTGIYPLVQEYIENGSLAPFSMRNEAWSHSSSSPMPPATESDVGFLPAAARPRPSNGSADIIMLLDLITKVPSVASASGLSAAELKLLSSSGNGFGRYLGAGGTSPPRHFPPPTPAPADPAPHPAPPAQTHFAPITHMANPPYPGAGSALTQPLRPPMPPQQPQNSPYLMGGRYPNQHFYPPYQ